jgi:hypothetical protein
VSAAAAVASSAPNNGDSGAISMSPTRAKITGVVILLLVVGLFFWIPAPWYLRLLIVGLTLPVFYAGGICVGRFPIDPGFIAFEPGNAALSPRERSVVEATSARLASVGIVPCASWLRESDPAGGWRVSFQHPETSDIFSLSVGTEFLFQDHRFLRRRADGSWLVTAASSHVDWLNVDPRNDELCLVGTVDPCIVWRAHQKRVLRDPRVCRNPAVSDPLAFQTEYERRETEGLVAAGYKTHAGGGLVRYTVIGALKASFRFFPPWSWLRVRRRRREFLSLLDGEDAVAVRLYK